MSTRRLLALFAIAIVSLVALPAVADAKPRKAHKSETVEFRGVVSGSPYGASNGYMAVPVLYSKQTLRNYRLKSPVGLLMVRRTLKVKLPNGAPKILPVNMRTGDRFKGWLTMKSIYQRTFYPRVTFKKVTVYFRSKELSTAELNAAIQKLQGDVARLTTWLGQLSNYTSANFADVRAQIADLRNALASLRSDLDALKSSLAGIQKQLDDLAAKLQAQIDALEAKAAKAEARGDAKAAQQARDSAATYQEWLAQAQQAASDFTRGPPRGSTSRSELAPHRRCAPGSAGASGETRLSVSPDATNEPA